MQSRALGFVAIGLKSGILDADIYGHFSAEAGSVCAANRARRARACSSRWSAFGVKVMSIGFLVEEDLAHDLRGPW